MSNGILKLHEFEKTYIPKDLATVPTTTLMRNLHDAFCTQMNKMFHEYGDIYIKWEQVKFGYEIFNWSDQAFGEHDSIFRDSTFAVTLIRIRAALILKGYSNTNTPLRKASKEHLIHLRNNQEGDYNYYIEQTKFLDSIFKFSFNAITKEIMMALKKKTGNEERPQGAATKRSSKKAANKKVSRKAPVEKTEEVETEVEEAPTKKVTRKTKEPKEVKPNFRFETAKLVADGCKDYTELVDTLKEMFPGKKGINKTSINNQIVRLNEGYFDGKGLPAPKKEIALF